MRLTLWWKKTRICPRSMSTNLLFLLSLKQYFDIIYLDIYWIVSPFFRHKGNLQMSMLTKPCWLHKHKHCTILIQLPLWVEHLNHGLFSYQCLFVFVFFTFYNSSVVQITFFRSLLAAYNDIVSKRTTHLFQYTVNLP